MGASRNVRLICLAVAAPLGVLVPLHAAAQPVPPRDGGSSASPQQTPAQPPGTSAGQAPENASNLRESQEHLLRATDLFGRRMYREAIQEFELAYRASASADLWFNIARCHEQIAQDASVQAIRQQEFEAAVDHYQRYLRDKVDPPDRASVERRIAELRQLAEQARAAARRQDASSHVRFDVSTPGARVYLEDREVGRAPITRPVDVRPGTYPVRVTAPGMQEWRANVRVRQGETVTAYATLQPSTQYRTVGAPHIASFIIGGLGAASVVAGAVFGVLALTTNTTDASGMMILPPPGGCDGPGAMGNAVCDRRALATTSDVLFVVGAGLLATAVIVHFIERGSTRTERVAAPAAGRARASR